MKLTPPLITVSVLAILAGCGESEAPGGTARPGASVVATTTQVADIVRNVGGRRAEVRGLLGANADPHDYEPRPSDAQGVTDARVVFKSGGDLDEWISEVTESAGVRVPVVEMLDSVESIEGGHGHEQEHAGEEKEHTGEEEHGGEEAVDPHWWHDPRNGMAAVEVARQRLAEADPAGRAVYEGNARAYSDRLRRLDQGIERCMSAIPAEQRKLVTTHDALGYFAERYDIEAVGSVLDSLSTQAQPSAGDTRELVDQIREEGVSVVFAESSVDSRVEQAIARETGARVGGQLYADTLGPAGSSGDTYLKSLAANAEAMARGFTGGRRGCSLPS